MCKVYARQLFLMTSYLTAILWIHVCTFSFIITLYKETDPGYHYVIVTSEATGFEISVLTLTTSMSSYQNYIPTGVSYMIIWCWISTHLYKGWVQSVSFIFIRLLYLIFALVKYFWNSMFILMQHAQVELNWDSYSGLVH